jgi:hypothetical protein
LIDLPRIYETLRKVRRVKTSRGDSYEYLVNIPREWVEAVAREQKVELTDTKKGMPLYFKIRYDGKLEMEPKVVAQSRKADSSTVRTSPQGKGD